MIIKERAKQYWEDKRNEVTLNVKSTKVENSTIVRQCKTCGSWDKEIKCRYCGNDLQ
jgi:hypothetical protein